MVFTAIKDSEVVNCNLLAFLNISQCIDSVLNTINLAFLGVIIVGMINTTCFKKGTPFPHIVPKRDSVRSDDSKVLRGRVLGVNVMHREESLSLVHSERINLLTYRCGKGLAVKHSFNHFNNRLFGEYACTPGNLSCGDESFAFPLDLLKGIH